jgi:hypothetical protein
MQKHSIRGLQQQQLLASFKETCTLPAPVRASGKERKQFSYIHTLLCYHWAASGRCFSALPPARLQPRVARSLW